MKKIVGLILLAVMVLIAVPAKSQIKFGIKGGLNISSVHFNKDLVGKDNVTGFNIGPMVEVMAPIMGVGFDAAILYSQKGIGVKSEKDIKNDYIDVPVNLKWKFGLPIIKGYLAAGPYVGFRVGVDALLFELGYKFVLVISALQHGKNGAFRHVGELPVLNL